MSTVAAPVVALDSVPCNLWGSTRTRELYSKPDTRFWISTEAFTAVCCVVCGLGFVNPRPTTEAIKAFYPLASLREIARVLKPSGRFVGLVTNLQSVWSRYAYGEDVPRDLYFFSAATLGRYASAAGLRLRGLDYSSSVLRADGRDVFRVRMLRRLGFDWWEIYRAGHRRRAVVRLAERAATALGRLVCARPLEVALRIPGVVVATMEKPS